MHSVQGWSVFLAAVVMLAYADRAILALSRFRAKPAVPEPRTTPANGPFTIAGPHLVALALLVVAMLAVSLAVPRWQLPDEARFQPISLPVTVEGWRLNRHLPPDETYLGTVRYTTYASRPYSRDDDLIFLFIGYDDRIDRQRSMISPKNAFPDGAWDVLKRDVTELAPGGPPVDSVLIRSRDRVMLSFSWYENRESLLGEVARALLALDRGGVLAIAGIHLSDVPALNYQRHLFQEREIRSVTANTREDGRALLALAEQIPIQTHTKAYALAAANEALADLKSDRIQGAAVLDLRSRDHGESR